MARVWLSALLCACLTHVARAECVYVDCDCEQNADRVAVIECSARQLSTLPTFTGHNQMRYDALLLTSNYITNLTAGMFHHVPVRKLDLRDNGVSFVADDAFAGLESRLEELLLGLATATLFPARALARLTRLRALTVVGCGDLALPGGALAPFAQLHSLALPTGALSELTPADVRAQVDTLTALDLRYNHLKTVPSALASLTALRVLNLGENLIREVPAGALRHLTELDLSQNVVASMDERSLEGCRATLRVLRLPLCQLFHLKAVRGLTALRWLDVSHNQLPALDPNVFTGMQHLERLYLRSNEIKRLSAAMLTGLTGLKELSLQANKLSEIAPGTFAELRSLQALHLDAQTSLAPALADAAVFRGLEDALRNLSLSGVAFGAASWPAIQSLTNLRKLLLAENALMSLPPGAFSRWTRLATIDLSRNALRELDGQRAFAGLERSLRSIDLRGNELRTLGECTFFEFDRRLKIDLLENPLQCDCRLRWLPEWIAAHYSRFNALSVQWQCSDDEHRGALIRDLDPKSFVCVPHIPAPRCVPSTVAPSTTPAATTEASATVLTVNATAVSDTTIELAWRLFGRTDGLNGFMLSYRVIGNNDRLTERHLAAGARAARLTHLQPEQTYYVCVHANYQRAGGPPGACTDVTTLVAGGVGAQTAGPTATQLALGSVFGVIAGVLVIALVVLCVRRHRRRRADPSLAGRLRLGYDSKRFSRPSTVSARVSLDNVDNQRLERKLEGFSGDERDRILTMLTANGGGAAAAAAGGARGGASTESIARYVPDLPPRNAQDGYMNAAVTLSDEQTDEHLYSEIPAEVTQHM